MDFQDNTLKRGIEDGIRNDDKSSKETATKALRFSLRNKKWTYRGEGNANIVIALPQERKVIRFRKSNGVKMYSPGESATTSLEAKFCLEVMMPLLGACYVIPPTIITLDSLEILELETQLAHQRPVSRLHKVIQASDAALYMDVTLLPVHLSNDTSRSQRFSTYCVEIKPKQGWVPEADRQLHKCRFCLQQYLKVMTGKVESLSQYCPLDLFSGNSWRMKKALCSLLETPQNNLKIFQDGALIYGQGAKGSVLPVLKDWLSGPTNINDSKKLLDKFCFVIMEALLRDMTSRTGTYEAVRKRTPNCDRFIEGGNGCRVGKVKESLDTMYIEPSLSGEDVRIDEFVEISVERVPIDLLRTAKEVAFQALKIGKEYPCNWEDEDQLPENCVLERILNIQKLDVVGADSVYKAYHEGSVVGTPSNFSYIPSMMDPTCELSPIHRYLLATTAKDCSIMLTFQEDFDSRCRFLAAAMQLAFKGVCVSMRCKPTLKRHMLQCPDGQKFIFNVGVIDLEPKPISCIEKHARRDCDVCNAYVDWHL